MSHKKGSEFESTDKRHPCMKPNDQDLDEGIEYLYHILRANCITPADFVKSFLSVMDKEDPKVNTYCLYGPTNTGKSLICKLATQFMEVSSICILTLCRLARSVVEETRQISIWQICQTSLWL